MVYNRRRGQQNVKSPMGSVLAGFFEGLPFYQSKEIVVMSTGTVKWFDASKGYGFITPEDGGKDLFVHYSEIQTDGYATLSDGQQVEYKVGEGQKGPCATKVVAV
jgi:CspA family cold shock protein